MKQEKGSTLLLNAARAKRTFWLERFEAAVVAKDREAQATAQRFAQEYEHFITLLTGQIGTT